MWVNLQYYETGYLLGRPPAIPAVEFEYWSRAAEMRINWRRVTLVEVPEYLKLCVCEVAELLYRAERGPKPGDLISESHASYSWRAQEAKPAADTNAEIGTVIIKHLAGTDLHNEFVSRAV